MFDLIEKFIEAHQLFCGSVLAFFTSMIRLWRKSNCVGYLGTEKMKELILKHFGDVENVDKQ